MASPRVKKTLHDKPSCIGQLAKPKQTSSDGNPPDKPERPTMSVATMHRRIIPDGDKKPRLQYRV